MVDRIVDGIHAVLLIGDEETEQVIPAEQLPDHVTEGTLLFISRDDKSQIVGINLDEDSTAEVQERITSKLNQLRQRGKRLPGA